jgi:hypothetical protein
MNYDILTISFIVVLLIGFLSPICSESLNESSYYFKTKYEKLMFSIIKYLFYSSIVLDFLLINGIIIFCLKYLFKTLIGE